jgi:DNA adenine methylase
MSKATRPVLRYHGGKWRLAPWIVAHFPPHRVYVEPYGGGGSVLMRKPRSYSEVYNEASGEVVNVFRVLQDEGKAAQLARLLYLTPYAREEFDASYGEQADDVDRARYTLVRSFQGYGSASTAREHATGFRAHAHRNGTTPAHDWANYPKHVRTFVARLRGVVIENRDALEVIAQQDSPGTLFYVDPPYPLSTRNSNHQSYAQEMTDDDHRRMAEVLHRVRGMVVLSGYACPLYDRDLFRAWERHECRTIKSTNNASAPSTEVLWLNDAAARARGQGNLFDALQAGRREEAADQAA